ncbi:response regulator [Bacteroidota bacterium]
MSKFIGNKILLIAKAESFWDEQVLFLKSSGYIIEISRSGQESAHKAHDIMPDLILIDHGLLNLDGIDIIRQIKMMQLKSNPYLLVIAKQPAVLSNEIESLENGADGCISNSKNLKLLLARIDSYFRLRKSEYALKESERKYRELNDQKNKVFSIITHDLKAPFNTILGFSDVLNSEIENLSKEEINLSAFNIYSSALDANSLLSNLLEWSKMNWQTLSFVPVSFNLDEFIEDVLSAYESILDYKGIEVSTGIKKSIRVFADKNMMHTVIRNIISNAIKFSNQNSEIHILAEEVNGMVQICVQDFGVGIKDENKEKVLQQNSYFSTIGTKDEKGSGLGLNICLDLVKRNNGEIWFDSQVGKGTRFYVTLPAKPDELTDIQKSDSELSTGSPDLAGKTILVVEDLENIYKYIEYILRRVGVHCIWASNGKQGVNLYSENKQIDLILMDLQMPVMDGLTAIRKIREYDKKVPIIVQTAYSELGEREESFEAGCNDYILKPLEIRELLDVIGKYI